MLLAFTERQILFLTVAVASTKKKKKLVNLYVRARHINAPFQTEKNHSKANSVMPF